MSETRLNRAIAGAAVALILLIIAAVMHPLLARPGDPPASQIPTGGVSLADTPDSLTLVQVKQEAAKAQVAAVRASAITTPPATPKPAATPSAPPAATPVHTPAPVQSPPAAAPVSGTNYAASAFGACVRKAEEGGSYAWGPGDGGGAYQFLYSTWVKYGGAPSAYGNAGPAYQDQIFNNAVAANRGMDWTPYDGCVL